MQLGLRDPRDLSIHPRNVQRKLCASRYKSLHSSWVKGVESIQFAWTHVVGMPGLGFTCQKAVEQLHPRFSHDSSYFHYFFFIFFKHDSFSSYLLACLCVPCHNQLPQLCTSHLCGDGDKWHSLVSHMAFIWESLEGRRGDKEDTDALSLSAVVSQFSRKDETQAWGNHEDKICQELSVLRPFVPSFGHISTSFLKTVCLRDRKKL